MSAQEIFDQLCAPFASEQISWRVGNSNKKKNQRENGPNAKATKGQALAYIDARDVMDRLDAVVGPFNWQSEYVNAGNNATCCRVGILFPEVGWVWKADGAGQTDFEGDKGQFSDAFKRAAVKWGIGRYLYDLDAPWVDLDEREQIPPSERKKLDERHEMHARRMGWGGEHARAVGNALRIVDSAIHHFVSDPSQAVEFQKANEGVLAALPKSAREHVLDKLSRVGAPLRAAE